MPRATINGTEMQYELTGSGEQALVFLNGIAMSIAHWTPLVQPLSERCRCLRHDFRGQMLSPRKAGAAGPPLALSDHVDDLRVLLDSLGIQRAHLIGTSYGAEVAMMFALACPSMTASLVVIDGVSELDPLLRATAEAWKTAALADPVAFYRSIIPWNYSSSWIGVNAEALRRREAGIAALPRGYFEDFAALCDAFLALDITARLHDITCATLVVVAEKDILKHAGFARMIVENIPGSRLKVIEGAGHAVVIEKPGAVLAEIEAFLGGGY